MLQRTFILLNKKRFNKSIQKCSLEYLPHHFQNTVAPNLPKVITCLDIHIYDVPWKYKSGHQVLLNRFKSNIVNSSAILFPFPRPFRVLPSLIKGIENKIFLTICPTLLGDISVRHDIVEEMRIKYFADKQTNLLIYPAQLQEHKNHKNLCAAINILRKSGHDIRLVCPGSDFKQEIGENGR